MEGTIGQYLKECREKEAITIEQVSEKTHIKTRILKQLENNDFENLGGIGYARSFILSYARIVKANEPKILLMLDNLFSDRQVKYYRVDAAEPKKVLIPTSIFSIFILIILIAVLSFVTIRLHKEGKLATPNLKKITNTINFKNIFKKKDEKPIEKIETPEETIEEKKLNRSALYDTTDYSKDLIFSDGKNPLNEE